MTDKTNSNKQSSTDILAGTGSPSNLDPAGADPGAEGGSGSGSGSKREGTKSGSMKVKRTTSGSKVSRSKSSSGSMKKRASDGKASKAADGTDLAGGEMEMLTQKQNGSAGEGQETEEQEQEEKKEHRATIKGLWKKAFKSLKSSSGEQKWSVKKGASLKRRDSKETEEPEPEEPKEIDPVYSLLKCAADLPRASRASKDGQQLTPQGSGSGGGSSGGGGGGGGGSGGGGGGGGGPCSGLVARHGDSSGSTSKASSPSSSGLPPVAPDGTCTRCGATHRVDMLLQTTGQAPLHRPPQND